MTSAGWCPRCNAEETTIHTFFLCPFAKEVWRLAPLLESVHLADVMDFKAALVLFRNSICLPPTGIRSPIVPWIVWFLNRTTKSHQRSGKTVVLR